MATLSRTVRFCINPGDQDTAATEHASHNGYGGHPSSRGWARYYEIQALCRGTPEAHTGYLINIKDIDRAVRAAAVPLVARACRETPQADPAALRPALCDAVNGALGGRLPGSLSGLTLRLTPYYRLSMDPADTTTVTIRQRFDFAASHRLHVPELSEDENRRIFGRCNNRNGHGHNYQVEPAVDVTLTDRGEPAISLQEIERITDETLIDPFDHTHLNEDTEQFSWEDGVNPSVENIARVFYEELRAAIERPGVKLREVTVWETERTSCTYPGG